MTITPSELKRIHKGLVAVGFIFPIGLGFALVVAGASDVEEWAKWLAGIVAAVVAVFGVIGELTDPPRAEDLERSRQRVAYLRDLMTSITLPALLSLLLIVGEKTKITPVFGAIAAVITLGAAYWGYRLLKDL